MDLPILKIPRSAGDGALLAHKLTPEEHALFKLMDAATASLPEEADQPEYHRVVAGIGAGHGLSDRESVAFWTRATFMTFEP